MGKVWVEMCTGHDEWKLKTLLFADNTVLIAENDGDLQNPVNKFNNVWKRRKIKVSKSKLIDFFVRKIKSEVIIFTNTHRVKGVRKQWMIKLSGRREWASVHVSRFDDRQVWKNDRKGDAVNTWHWIRVIRKTRRMGQYEDWSVQRWNV